MARRSDTSQMHWLISGVVAALAISFVALLFRAPPPFAAAAATPSGLDAIKGVTLVSENDRVVSDESILLDPTPLFLPTKWNYTQRALPQREAGGRSQGYDTPKLTFSENELKLGLPTPIAVPAGVPEAVAEDIRKSPLVGFGRTDVPLTPLQGRGAFIEVVSTRTGRRMLAQPIEVGPPGSAVWQPVEYLAQVNAAGLVGRPVVTSRSGVDEVDVFFANYLVRTLRIGERLEPGFYRISIGP